MRLHRLAAGVAGLIATTGCYTLQPVGAVVPADGQQVGYDISDVGRVALGGTMGASIGRIEGRLVRREADDLLVSVSAVSYVSGGVQTWSGEPVRLKPEFINTTYVRRLSKTRTVAAGAVAAAAIAFFVTRSLNGGGTAEITPPHDSTGTTYRGPRP